MTRLFLGKTESKQQIWQIHETIRGFESSDKLLAAGDDESTVEVLPPAREQNDSNPQTRKIEQIESDEDFELDDDEFDD